LKPTRNQPFDLIAKANNTARAVKATAMLKTVESEIWLGRKDSNPRMAGPKPAALPLGDAPITYVTMI
jgi:hypothetical protein